MLAKRAQENSGTTNPFLDPEGYKKFVEGRERAFLNELAKQKAAAAAANP
jgi:metallo-beta-lactamase class B